MIIVFNFSVAEVFSQVQELSSINDIFGEHALVPYASSGHFDLHVRGIQ